MACYLVFAQVLYPDYKKSFHEPDQIPSLLPLSIVEQVIGFFNHDESVTLQKAIFTSSIPSQVWQ
jgi:hypothetical protein